MSNQGHNLPELGPYAEMWRLAAEDFERAKYAVAVKENELDVKLAVILDHDEGAKTTAKERAKNHPEYQRLHKEVLATRLQMRLKQTALKAAEMGFEEWRTRSSNRRSEMNIR